VITVGELCDVFADQIPLHSASRKWLAGRPSAPFSTPDRMRFYALTQYLHWLGCSFRPDGIKTRTTVVTVRAKDCPVCGQLFVYETQQTCSVQCGQQLRRRSA
jgi:hypothetical protein